MRVRDGGLGSPSAPRVRQLRPASPRTGETRCLRRKGYGEKLSGRAIASRGAESGLPDEAPGFVRLDWLRRGGARARAASVLEGLAIAVPRKVRGHLPWRREVHGASRPEPVRRLGRCFDRRLPRWWAGSGRSRGRARGSHTIAEVDERRRSTAVAGRAPAVTRWAQPVRESGPVKRRRKPDRGGNASGIGGGHGDRASEPPGTRRRKAPRPGKPPALTRGGRKRSRPLASGRRRPAPRRGARGASEVPSNERARGRQLRGCVGDVR